MQSRVSDYFHIKRRVERGDDDHSRGTTAVKKRRAEANVFSRDDVFGGRNEIAARREEFRAVLSLDDADNVDDDDDPQSTSPVRVADPRSPPPAKSLTPLEVQIVALHRRVAHLNIVAFIQVGYKYRLFGNDAVIAAEHCDIVAHHSRGAFVSASVPIHRVMIHVRALVNAGHKVGIVEQTESAAAKANDRSAGPFKRELTRVYTAATIGAATDSTTPETTPHHYLVAVKDEDDGRRIHLLALDVGTGDVVWESIERDDDTSGVESVLADLAPIELVLPTSNDAAALSASTERVISAYCCDADERVRLERVREWTDLTALDLLYSAGDRQRLSDAVPSGVLQCVSAMIRHLQHFSVTRTLSKPERFRRYTRRSDVATMILHQSAVEQLNLFVNNATGGVRGSLYWLLDQTRSAIGSRLLREWIRRPLMAPADINQRLDAVTELANTALADAVRNISTESSRVDMERAMTRLINEQCSLKEIVAFLNAVRAIANVLTENVAIPQSLLLRSLIAAVQAPYALSVASSLLDHLDVDAVFADDKANCFRSSQLSRDIVSASKAIVDCEESLLDLLATYKRSVLGVSYQSLTFRSVNAYDYLIEVKSADVGRIPSHDWIQVSATKSHVRYHTHELRRRIQRRQLAQETLSAAIESSRKSLCRLVAEHYTLWRTIAVNIATLDVLDALARVSQLPNYTRPQVAAAADSTLTIRSCRHAMVEATSDQSFVGNDCEVSSGDKSFVLLTSPNMAGKSTFLRSVALCVIMAQIGSYVSADHLVLSPLDSVEVRMGSGDDIARGRSTFYTEIEEIRAVLARSRGRRSLLLIDEIGRRTSTFDGAAIAAAIGREIIASKQLTLFVTHYAALAHVFARFNNVSTKHLSFITRDGDERITFLFRLVDGVSPSSFGVNVARMARLPTQIIRRAIHMSNAQRNTDTIKRLTNMIARIIQGDVTQYQNAKQMANQAISQTQELSQRAAALDEV